MKKTIAWRRLLGLILVAFFLFGAFTNLFGPMSVAEEFARWGYPLWFRYVTGTLELAAAILLLTRRLQILGILLGGLVMASALLTVLIHEEWAHAVPAAIVLPALYLLHKKRKSRR